MGMDFLLFINQTGKSLEVGSNFSFYCYKREKTVLLLNGTRPKNQKLIILKNKI